MSVADTGYPTQIVPYIGLLAAQPTSSTTAGSTPQSGPQRPAGGNGSTTNPKRYRPGTAHNLTIQTPTTLSATRARQGIKVTVNNAPKGKLVTATLAIGTRTLAHRARRAPREGTLNIILKPDSNTPGRLHAGDQLKLIVTFAGARIVRTIRLQTAPPS